MKIECACAVEQGRRSYNDDRAMICGNVVNCGSDCACGTMPEMAAVCDGCGGHSGGYVAAQLVLETLARQNCAELLDETALSAALHQAEKRIVEAKEMSPQFGQMCTTVAGCVFGKEKTLIFHSGDTRVYRYDGGRIARMTIDHSAVQELVDMGQITEEEARVHPNRNIIRRAIGLGGLPPEIYVCGSSMEPGEIYLICSDGLWESLTDERIQELLSVEQSLEKKAKELVEAALKSGSDDNISVVLCSRFDHVPQKQAQRLILD